MITKFDNFINEWYLGPYSSTGFKTNEPTTKYNFTIDIKMDTKNEEIIKNILKKYNITYNKLELKNIEVGDEKGHNINLVFNSYNKYEASAILNSVMKELIENKIPFDPESIKFDEEDKPEKRKIGYI